MNVFDFLREKLGKLICHDNNRKTVYLEDAIEIVNQVEQEFAPKTNADLIRRMTDEQLADAMLKFPDVCERIGFCKNDILCNDTLDRGEMIEPEMCKRCLMNWLGKEA